MASTWKCSSEIEGDIKSKIRRNRAQGRPEEDGDGTDIGEGGPRRVFCCRLPSASSGGPPASGIISGRPSCGHGSSDTHGSLQDTWSLLSRTTHEDEPVQWQEVHKQ
ncbi:hypothetical protein C2845_PM06G31360 [Panicum miliaceum]|uniref:Uncharacterized protein n=1 Tax=Panicum miliaceum TaxID=4540 RepID=A0A3L6RDP2_PANMI|nr:hypothetical protein C2845_PM06G31360 [Panicum miliaceum]